MLIFCDGIARCWKRIIYFHPVERRRRFRPSGGRGFRLPTSPEGYRIVGDERGVCRAALSKGRSAWRPWSALAERAAAGGTGWR